MKAAIPSMVVYIAKLDGRYEMLAWNMPGDVAMMRSHKIAILGFRVAAMALNNLVSHSAQTPPRMIRRA